VPTHTMTNFDDKDSPMVEGIVTEPSKRMVQTPKWFKDYVFN